MTIKKQKLVYLAAASHSGSTMTAMLLGAHPDLCSVGELKAVNLGDKNSYLCSCKTLVGECGFWQGVTQKMADKGHDFCISEAGTDIRTGATPYVLRLLKPLVRSPLMELVRDTLLCCSPVWRKSLPLLQKRNADYARSISEQAGVDIVVDSSKIGIRLKYLLKNPDLDVKVIWVVRDGRGVSLAYKNPSEFADAKNPKLRGGGAGKTQEQGRGIEVGAHEWVRCNQEAEAVLATMPKNNWIRVHYEDICNNTEQTLDTLFEFIGVDPAKKRLDFKTVEHHVVGNGMRLDDSEVIQLDDRWKTLLSEGELQTYYQVTGDYHRHLGYVE
ncbi:sulfotransferase [Psychromonas sp. 14N.309.X.WAT.B.A12]|uniref:sulfotransferase n=1 Tax=unclassified Psychromonas TaxID=2614957 RepID=UPI0025B192A8|nr:sulfotransferase [Psychromonas sp. 14N.309.X.WAT.B.A12]MDN2662789.1 sulfotransferase [Psychromonas sp. 14N.309.X.WAT.B.A12]